MKRLLSCLAIASIMLLSTASFAAAADSSKTTTLYIGPTNKTITVGSVFEVSFYVHTGGNFINAVEADVLFPADKLQVVSPSTGSSFINVWAIQPSYSNTQGTITFRGAVPSPGINTANGLISTVAFRVKSVGNAVIRFGNDSHVLLNDGLGTDVLQHTDSAVYTLVLPPPAGPRVVSRTHPDQTQWYTNNTVSLSWSGDDGADGYSYMLSDEPVDIPDTISAGPATSVVYDAVTNGRHYFHIQALRGGVWGGTTHFAIMIDTGSPAQFPISIIPNHRTSQRQPAITFLSTDADSGLNRYEIKIVPLHVSSNLDGQQATAPEKPFFIEAQSPYIPSPLELGRYDVVVRAYDNAGNYRESAERLEIASRVVGVMGSQGIMLQEEYVISWPVAFGIVLILLLAIGCIARAMRHRHHGVIALRKDHAVPPDIAQKLAQLKAYQHKYGKIAAIVCAMFVSGLLLGHGPVAHAQRVALSPPLITTISRDIFNDEIFYVGGRTAAPMSEVVLYLQNTDGAQTLSYHVPADSNGEWFYRHDGFLPAGNYLVWAQAQNRGESSPPSPQIVMSVISHVVSIAGSRITYESIYFVIMVIVSLILIVLLAVSAYHYVQGKQKHAKLLSERAKIDETIRRGFALLQRDVEEEIMLLHRLKRSPEFSQEEQQREEQLRADMEVIKRNIGEEVWELEKLGG